MSWRDVLIIFVHDATSRGRRTTMKNIPIMSKFYDTLIIGKLDQILVIIANGFIQIYKSVSILINPKLNAVKTMEIELFPAGNS